MVVLTEAGTHHDVRGAPEHDDDRGDDEYDQRMLHERGGARGAVREGKRERDGVVRRQRNSHPSERTSDLHHRTCWQA